MSKEYIAIVNDAFGNSWVYEGTIDNHPFFIKEKNAHPKLLTEKEAYITALQMAEEGEEPEVRKFC